MKQKSKKVRKNIMVNPNLVKRARKILNAPSDSQAIETALEEIAQRKTEDEIQSATYKFLRHFSRDKIKPIFD